MDDIVKAALAKWPKVPACHGWLALDARGQWFMRDERAQAAGPFPRPKGSRIEHAGLLGFIARNYAATPSGEWYFQNGPQRVYVTLEAAPWVLQAQPDGRWRTHTGSATRLQHLWEDEAGRVFATTPLGLGIVASPDVGAVAGAIEAATLPAPEPITFTALLREHGVCLRPYPR